MTNPVQWSPYRGNQYKNVIMVSNNDLILTTIVSIIIFGFRKITFDGHKTRSDIQFNDPTSNWDIHNEMENSNFYVALFLHGVFNATLLLCIYYAKLIIIRLKSFVTIIMRKCG